MTDNNLYMTFEQDTKQFINQINENLIKLENGGYSADVINQIFRYIHSIKSEAAYLDCEDISVAAHEMESAIEPLRNVGTSVEVDPAMLEFCFKTVDKIGKLTAAKQFAEDEETEAELEELEADETHYTVIDDEDAPYSSFELLLLKEARSRGEKLYSLSFGISADEVMKYPRAYLALSNLEKHMNVIKSSPEIEEIDRSEDGRLTVILTSFKNESEIAAEVNIDQIINIDITELSFDDELNNVPLKSGKTDPVSIVIPERVISVEADEIDALSEYIGEIKKRLSGLSSAMGTSGDDRISYDLAGIETISDSIEKIMSNLQTVDFNVHFSGYKRTVRDLAAKLGKKAELIFDDDNMRLPRELADFLAEPMLQIIRNAVVHGIELPSEREANGKNENGIIRVSLGKEEDSTIVTVSDDGSGIDEEAVLSAAEFADDGILGIISRPGFTTLSKSEHFAGRGVGLDLVNDRISKRGGYLELTTAEGHGCEFRIIISGKNEVCNYLVVESEGTVCAVGTSAESDVIDVDASMIEVSGDSCFYKGLQIFNVNGRLKDKPHDINNSLQAIKIDYLGKSALVIFNESLFEVSHRKTSVDIGKNEGKYTRKLIINGKEAEYLFLSPEVIFD